MYGNISNKWKELLSLKERAQHQNRLFFYILLETTQNEKKNSNSPVRSFADMEI